MTLSADKIFGSLLGLVLADALGARFEGLPPEQLREQFANKEAALDYSIGRGGLRYTDDGQMALALATSFAATDENVTPESLSAFLLPASQTVVFQRRLAKLAQVRTSEDMEQFGNGIEAHESVVTALACFALFPSDYRQAIATAIWQGGDTDTIAAMTGALVGAHIGCQFANAFPLDRLE